MLISVVTVCRNAEKMIEKTIKSVLAMEFTDFEHIIIDGASEDGTMSVIDRYAGEYAKKGIAFSVISEPDGGIYDAMNKGIKMAQGDWIMLLNAGDAYHDGNVFNEIEQATRRFRVDILAGNMIFQEGYLGRVYRSRKTNRMKEEMALMHATMCVKRELYEAKPFSTEYKISGDYEWSLYYYLNDAKIEIIDIIMVDFDGNGVSNKNKNLARLENYQIQRKYGLLGNDKPPRKPNIKSRIYKKIAYVKPLAKLYYKYANRTRSDIYYLE